MKKNVEMVERTIKEEKVTYVAVDGTVFLTEEACKEWEQDYKCSLNVTYKKIPKAYSSDIKYALPYANDDNRVDFLKPQSEEDITTINGVWRILTHSKDEPYLTFKDINKIIAVDFGYIYDNTGNIFKSDWCSIDILEEYMDKLKTSYEELIKAFEEQEQEA